MNQSISSHTQLNRPLLRALPSIHEEERRIYDADFLAQQEPARREAFAMMPSAVFELGDGQAIAVYAVLAKHADKEGKCWPSMKRLEASLGWTDNRIRPALKKLIDAGLVTVEKRKLHGMDQSNVYRLSAYEQVSRDRTPVSREGALGIPSEALGYPATGHELDPIELNTKELEESTPQEPKAKPLPENGAAQRIVKAFCLVARLEAPANYGKAVGQAKLLARAGVTPEEIPELYEYVAGWAKGADLGLMLNQVDRWRTSKRVTATAHPNGMPPEIKALPWNSAVRLKWENDHRVGAI